MGCDIHMIVQIKKTQGWATVKCPNLDYKPDSEYSWEKEPESFKGYHDRNYDTFAILAGVRNGIGFAGCDTGDAFKPIAEPRGFPKDFVLESVDEDGDDAGYPDYHCGVWMGDHSHSWVTLAEIEAYDWQAAHKSRGWVNGTELKRMADAGETVPERYCGGVSGNGIEHVSIQELRRRITEPTRQIGCVTLNDLAKIYALYEWEETCAECVGRFYTEFLPFLRTLGKPEDVRLVMGFDS